jgi:hypothetical protein
MAKLKANRRPVKHRPDTRTFIGTCSNCRDEKVILMKVKHAQVCVKKCLGGVTFPEPEVREASTNEPGVAQELVLGDSGTIASSGLVASSS